MSLTENDFKRSRNYAQEMDDADALAKYRNQFFIPQINEKEGIYFCGNSLGLQPKTAKAMFEQELNDWAQLGVEGHFHAKNPWFAYHTFFATSLAKIVGAKATEVVAMNTLTVNLHLLMLSFYKPTKSKYKIIMEAGAFPSDQYAMETQVMLHGFNPNDAIIEITPRKGEYNIRTEDIETLIKKNKNKISLILLGGVNYYTGQFFYLEKVTQWGHEAGAMVGFDLAHAVGNKVLHLHDWEVDFACWCSYKYLNAGPGAVGGIYVNEKHCKDKNTFRLAGWWGHDEKTRFQMKKGFKPMKTAESWQMSNAQVFNMVSLRASLNIFDKAGMNAIAEKSMQLTAYAEFLLNQITNHKFKIITPTNPIERGCQLSLLFASKGKEVFEKLKSVGIITDWREPNVIRIAPVPLYNRFEDVFTLYDTLANA
jgi:kynureninase